MGYIVFNATDGICADPRTFRTITGATKALVDLIESRRPQGYWFTARMQRIPLSAVVMQVLDNGGAVVHQVGEP
jgi:hypothetical protein